MTLEMCFCLLGCKYFDELIHKEKVPTTIKSMQSMKMEFSSFMILENWSKIDPESRSPTKFGRSPTKCGKFT